MTFIGPIFAAIVPSNASYSALVNYVPLICTLVSFISNIIGVFLIATKVGRKPLMIISAVLLTITNIGSAVSM